MGTKQIDLHTTSTETVMARFIMDSLKWIYTHGKEPDLDKRIESAYEQFVGVPFDPRLAGRTKPFYLHGFPGHGKTTSIIKGGERIAAMLGLNFVVNPPDNYVPSKKDFVYLQEELSGEVSNLEIGGIPNATKFMTEEGVEFMAMTKLTKPQIIAAREAGAALINYDDVASAGPNVQNAVLNVAQFSQYQGIQFGSKTLISFTGNLGSIDGTNTARPSQALDGRCQHYHIEDSLSAWTAREMSRPEYQDEHGTGFVTEFLDSHPELFHVPKEGHQERAISCAYPSPRTWTGAVAKARETIYLIRAYENGDGHQSEFRKAAGDSWRELEDLFRSHVGDKVVSAAVGWYQSKISDAEPLARTLIEQGDLTHTARDNLKAKAGEGIQGDHLSFQNQFVNSMVDHCVRILSKAPDNIDLRNKTMTAFFSGLWDYFPCRDSTRTLAFNHFGARIKNADETFKSGETLDYEFMNSIIKALAAFAKKRHAEGATSVPTLSVVKESLVPALTGSLNLGTAHDIVLEQFDAKQGQAASAP